MENLPLKQIIEGAIMASEQPLAVDQLMQLFDKNVPQRSEVRAALKEIGADCDERGYELKKVASGYRFQVKSEYGEWVSRLWKEKSPRYSRVLLETLALVAYKQPITRGDIEEIRGVAVSTNIMRTLIEREWVRVVGHREVPGHPALYATTRNFLDYFNLVGLEELPSLSEIRELTSGLEELEMEEDLIEVRTYNIDTLEREKVASFADVDLDEVTEQVGNIQENIRSLFAPERKAKEEQIGLETAVGSEHQEVEQLGGTEKALADELAPEQARSVKITPITSVKIPADNSED